MALSIQVMDEFEFIAEHLAHLAGDEALDLKDDVAIWTPPAGIDAVISMDTLVEGIHFPTGKFDANLAQKLLAVNISDLTAKGADAIGYFLSLSTSRSINAAQLRDFCVGLHAAQNRYSLSLWGGDTTKSDQNTVLTMSIIGGVKHGMAVLRSNANVGDILCVTGFIGDAYLGLKIELKQLSGVLSESQLHNLNEAYHLPCPPYEFRNEIQQFATAALDVSDGLIADAGHLARASDVGLEINLCAIPLSDAARNWLSIQKRKLKALQQLVTGGDDYQTIMSISASDFDTARSLAEDKGVKLTEIGRVIEGKGVVCCDRAGNAVRVEKPGYTHF